MKPRVPSALLVAVCLLACRSTAPPEPPPLISSGTVGGVGYPHGRSTAADFAVLTVPARDRRYGYTQEHPVRVGGLAGLSGPAAERHYLNALLGPEGQAIRYERIGSCCAFETESSPFGGGLLDVYEITYDGLDAPLRLYLNMYDPGEPLIPVGMSARAP